MDRPDEIPLATPPRYEVAGFVIDFGREALLDGHGAAVELRPQAFRVLRYLALNAGRLVTKEELLGAVWPGAVVTDDSVIQAIVDVRHALGEAGRRVIKTIPRRGYILISTEVAQKAARNERVTALPLSPKRSHHFVPLAAALLIGFTALWIWQQLDGDDLAPDPERPSIAVLAFGAPRSDSDGDALARDVASELASELAHDSELRVISSQSSFQFAGTQTHLHEIARRLRCRYLVDGTVRRDGDHLRIAVDLIDSKAEEIVWSSVHFADRTTLGATQQELVSRIAGKLQVRVMDKEYRRALAQPPRSLDVYVLTAHGKSRMYQYTADGTREARRFFEQALAIDPGYAPAWVYLGVTNNVDVGLGLTGEWDQSRLPEVLGQIRRAIALRPDLSSAYAALSQALTLAGDHDAAFAAARKCCTLSPNSIDCSFSLGKAQLGEGDVEAAMRNLERALDRNPLGPASFWAYYGTALWASRRLGESIRAADECLTRAPDFPQCRGDRIAALVELGRVEEARQEAVRLGAKYPRNAAWRFAIGPFIDTEATADLRARRIAAAKAAGMLDGALPSSEANLGKPR